MPSPFPGMDPYLEHPEVWPGVHLLLISALAESLTPVLRPKYAVSVEVRLYETSGEQSLLVGIPDAAIQRSGQIGNSSLTVVEPSNQPISVRLPMPESVRQGYLEIREVSTRSVITAIELLSPVNKRPGQGRQTYLTKRERIFTSETHLVEVDLLRAWQPMPILGEAQHDYRILVSRSEVRPAADLYSFNVPDAIPTFPLPLAEGDREPTVNFKTLLNQVYDRGAYDLKLDYSTAPVPPLSTEVAAWAENQLSTYNPC